MGGGGGRRRYCGYPEMPGSQDRQAKVGERTVCFFFLFAAAAAGAAACCRSFLRGLEIWLWLVGDEFLSLFFSGLASGSRSWILVVFV